MQAVNDATETTVVNEKLTASPALRENPNSSRQQQSIQVEDVIEGAADENEGIEEVRIEQLLQEFQNEKIEEPEIEY